MHCKSEGFLTSEFGIISSTKVLPKPSRILFGREAEKGKIRTIPRTVQAVRYRTKIHHNFGKIMVTNTLHTVHRFLFLIFPARGPLSLVCMFISSSQEGASNDTERTLFTVPPCAKLRVPSDLGLDWELVNTHPVSTQ